VYNIAQLNIELPDGRVITEPHHEWARHHIRWRWLMDSYEGGEAYRTAVYSYDVRGYPVHNLIRHKREYPDPRQFPANGSLAYDRPKGTDQYAAAGDNDDYQLRLARTPVPTYVSEVMETHLSEIFSKEIDRESKSKLIEDWWRNVDGRGTKIDDFMADTIAPFLLVLGQLDLYCDHPKAPDGEVISTRADVARLNLDGVIASYILPDNMLWWTLNNDGTYLECLVQEHRDKPLTKRDSRQVRDNDALECVYRYWSSTEWRLYDKDSNFLESQSHPFGRVPIARVFDRRRPRTKNVGLPRYETVAELQREFYNRDSELILSDTLQAHPLIQGPEDYVQSDGTMPIGPGWLLPMKKDAGSGSYTGFEIIEFPKGGAESIRENLDRLRDRIDREAMLTKPAGAAGTSANTVAQSGISKQLDQKGGNKLLAKIAAVLESTEEALVKLALLVAGDGTIDEAAIESTTISYPREFDLVTSGELSNDLIQFQAILSQSGDIPETEHELLCRLVRLMLPGLPDDDYTEFDSEIEDFLATKVKEKQQMAEMGALPISLNPRGMIDERQQPNQPATASGEPATS